jgi:hypothetical protein
VPTFDELRRVMFDDALPTEYGEAVSAQVVGIDCRYRTDEVYNFAQLDPGRIWPLRGAANLQAAPIAETKVKGLNVIARTTNPNYWKDVLHGYIHDDDTTRWLPHNLIGDDYCRHMTSEHKVLDPKAGAWTWVPVTSSAPNHWWDCEYMQCAVAELCGVAGLQEVAQEQAPLRTEQTANPVDYRGRW